MSTNRAAARGPNQWVALVAVGAGVALVAAAYGSWWVGDRLAGLTQTLPTNPVEGFLRLAKGELVWPVQATIVAVASVVVLLVAGFVVLLTRSPRRRTDAPAAAMTRPGQMTGITGRSAREKATRLRPDTPAGKHTAPGLRVGVTVAGGAPLFLSWEDVGVVLAGPRMGKTHAVAIPAVCDAPGAVIATSNKADLYRHTRGVRATHGRVWCSDLQGIAGYPGQDWWWNPLTGVSSLAPARQLAGYFIDATSTPGATGNEYFTGGSQELLALHLLTAACAGGDLLHALAWLSDDTSAVPARILDAANQAVAAMAMRRARNLNPRQRDGLFDMARQHLVVLGEPAYAVSVTPPQRRVLDREGELGELVHMHHRDELIPESFVRSFDTLYALSKEGRASSSALTTALVGRLFDAAEAAARLTRDGRLATPLIAVLDEAANICKLSELPDQYSHFGSHGIVVVTVLQSPAQARKVWTEDQFEALRSASNIEYYGGGISDTTYLETISRRIGEHDVSRWSDSRGHKGERSRSQSWSREPIMPVEALAALPADRAIILSSGNSPVLVRKTFWQDTEHADAIRASLTMIDGVAATTTPTPVGGVDR